MIHAKKRWLLIAALSPLVSLALLAGVTDAQYPPAEGNVTTVVSSLTVPMGGNTAVSAQVLNEAGAPLSGQSVVFTIISEPGDDASIGSKTISKTTDAAGVARVSLYGGTTPGVVVVNATWGLYSSTTVIMVTGATAPSGSSASTAPPPPQAPFSPIILPPSTGDAGLAVSSPPAVPFVLPTTALVLLLAFTQLRKLFRG